MSEHFDFIVVGGGTAGCLIAERIASAPSKPAVALFESGSKHDGTSLRRTFDRFSLAYTHPELEYGYASTPQPQLGDREIALTRGRGLGGSSQTNFQVWSLASKAEFDAWAKAVDGPEWSFSSVLETVKKIENVKTSVPEGWEKYHKLSPGAHGFDGKVDVSIGPNVELEVKHILDAGAELGHPLNPDPNDGDPIGFGIPLATTRDGMRVTSASAYLGEKLPDNLTLFTDNPVTKIIFEGSKAIGVEYDTRQALARKEVILSAGTFDSPKLLLISGVGPKEELSALGINSVHDLPGVGKSLNDHAATPLTYHMGHGFSKRVAFSSRPEDFADALNELDQSGTGPLTMHHSMVPAAFFKAKDMYASDEFQRLETETQERLAAPGVPNFEFAINGPLIPPTYNFEDPEDSYLNFFVAVMQPQSKGEITLRSADPADKPLINPHYFEEQYDKAVFKTAIREALKWMETPSLKRFVKHPILAPASDSDGDLEVFLRDYGMGLFHPTSSVKMGKRTDSLSCVDHNLKVFGLQNLRVADMSIAPFLVSGHTQIVAYIIGHQAADKILEEWNL